VVLRCKVTHMLYISSYLFTRKVVVSGRIKVCSIGVYRELGVLNLPLFSEDLSLRVSFLNFSVRLAILRENLSSISAIVWRYNKDMVLEWEIGIETAFIAKGSLWFGG